jgi:recombination protein RecT
MAEQALALKNQHDQLYAYLGARKEQIGDALSEMAQEYMSPKKLLKLFLVAMRRQPKILQCTPASVLVALTRAGECGLDPTGKGGQGHLVPFKNGKTGKLELQFIPGYQGIVLNLMRTDTVLKVEAGVVFKGDHFDYAYGLNPRLEHIPVSITATTGPEIWDAIVAAWAIAWLPGGVAPTFVVVPKNDLIRVKNVSKAKSSDSPWQQWPDRMAMKTAVKQVSRLLPLDTEKSLIPRTLEIDNEPGTGEEALPIDLGEALVVEEERSRTDELKDKLAARRGATQQPVPEEPAPEEDGVDIELLELHRLIKAAGLRDTLAKSTRKAADSLWPEATTGFTVKDFADIIRDATVEELTSVPHVGKKTVAALCKILGVKPAEPAEAAEEPEAEPEPEPAFDWVPCVPRTWPENADCNIIGKVESAGGTSCLIAQHQDTEALVCRCEEGKHGRPCAHKDFVKRELERLRTPENGQEEGEVKDDDIPF